MRRAALAALATLVAPAALATLVAPAALAAQQRTSGTLELSSSRLRYAGDTASGSAFTIAPAFHGAGGAGSFDAAGGLSQFAAGGWSAQGVLAGSAFTPWPRVVGELAGTTGGSVHQDGTRTGQSLASLRLHLVRSGLGAWVGASAGQTWDTLGWHGVRGGEAGAWAQRGAALATLSLAPTRIADSIRFTDVQLSVRGATSNADLAATIGRRSGDVLARGGGGQGWVNASVALWIGRGVALTASAGRYPADPLQGYQSAAYGAIGVRLGLRDLAAGAARTSTPDRAPAPAVEPRGSSTVARAERDASRAMDAFEARRAGAGTMTFRVRAARAGRVEISGDFTGWRPVALARGGDGWWTVTVPVAAGSWQMNVRVDGGAWLVPPGLTALEDEEGGVVGVLVAPER